MGHGVGHFGTKSVPWVGLAAGNWDMGQGMGHFGTQSVPWAGNRDTGWDIWAPNMSLEQLGDREQVQGVGQGTGRLVPTVSSLVGPVGTSRGSAATRSAPQVQMGILEAPTPPGSFHLGSFVAGLLCKELMRPPVMRK